MKKPAAAPKTGIGALFNKSVAKGKKLRNQQRTTRDLIRPPQTPLKGGYR